MNPQIQVKESDLNSIRFGFTVLDDNVAIDLTGAVVRLVVRKPSGLTIIQDCTITDAINGKCELVLSSQGYVEIGNYTGELVITKDDLVSVTREFTFSSLDAILDDDTLESQNDWQSFQELLLNTDLRPILGQGNPNTVVTPEYVGQTYLDTLGMAMYFASTVANDAWLPFGSGGGGGGGSVYWNDILLKPTSFAPSAHTHVWANITDAPTQMTPTAHTHDWGTGITNKPDTYPPSTHSHAITDVTGLETALGTKLESIPPEYLTQDEGDLRYEQKGAGGGAAKTGATDPTGVVPDCVGQIYIDTVAKEAYIANSVTGDWQSISMDEIGGGGGSVDWTAITSKPETFPPSTHSHGITDVTGLDTALLGKSNTGHSHSMTDVTGLGTALDAKSDTTHVHTYAQITEKPTSFPPSAHGHTWGEITQKPTEFTPATHSHTKAQITDFSHNHAITEITDLSNTLDAKQPKPISVTAAPVTTPTHSGQVAVDATNKRVYIAEGTTAADWERLAETDYVDTADTYIKETILNNLKFWKGTQAEYDVLTPDANTVYFITG